jgi:hypothetical protein
VKELSITYIPRHKDTIDNFYDEDVIVLKQSFLDKCDNEFFHIMLCNIVGEDLPEVLTEAVMAYSDDHNLEKDVTVVFDYQ